MQLNGKGDDAHRLARFLVRELRGEIAREDRLSRLRSVLPLFLITGDKDIRSHALRSCCCSWSCSDVARLLPNS